MHGDAHTLLVCFHCILPAACLHRRTRSKVEVGPRVAGQPHTQCYDPARGYEASRQAIAACIRPFEMATRAALLPSALHVGAKSHSCEGECDAMNT